MAPDLLPASERAERCLVHRARGLPRVRLKGLKTTQSHTWGSTTAAALPPAPRRALPLRGNIQQQLPNPAGAK